MSSQWQKPISMEKVSLFTFAVYFRFVLGFKGRSLPLSPPLLSFSVSFFGLKGRSLPSLLLGSVSTTASLMNAAREIYFDDDEAAATLLAKMGAGNTDKPFTIAHVRQCVSAYVQAHRSYLLAIGS